MKYVISIIVFLVLVFPQAAYAAETKCKLGKSTCDLCQKVKDKEFSACQKKEELLNNVAAKTEALAEQKEALDEYHSKCMFGDVRTQAQQKATYGCWTCQGDKPHLISKYDRVKKHKNGDGRRGKVNEFGMVEKQLCSDINCANGRKMFGAQLIGDTAWGSEKATGLITALPLEGADGDKKREIDVAELKAFIARDGSVLSVAMGRKNTDKGNEGERASERVFDFCTQGRGRLVDNIHADRTALCQEFCGNWHGLEETIEDELTLKIKLAAESIETFEGTVAYNLWLKAEKDKTVDKVEGIDDVPVSTGDKTGTIPPLREGAEITCGSCDTELCEGKADEDLKKCECEEENPKGIWKNEECSPIGGGPEDKPKPKPTYAGDDENTTTTTSTDDASSSAETAGAGSTAGSDILASGAGKSGSKDSKGGKGSTSGLISMHTPKGGGSGSTDRAYGSGMRGGAAGGAYGSGAAVGDDADKEKKPEIVNQEKDVFQIAFDINSRRYFAGLLEDGTATEAAKTAEKSKVKKVGSRPKVYPTKKGYKDKTSRQ